MTSPSPPTHRFNLDSASRYPGWRPAERLELASLRAESDPELRAEALLGMAGRLEQSGRMEAALEIYSGLQAEGESRFQAQAQARLDALLGRGPFGGRAEFLFRHFAQQASDPAALLAMGAAGAAFRVARLATLSRLTTSLRSGFLTQLLGAGRLASLAGFAVEAPTFSLALRLGHQGLGRSQDWSGRAVARDLVSGYLLLGGLKFAAWGSAAAYRSLATGGLRGGILQSLFEQGGAFTGILLGHALEQQSGLRPRQEGATTLLDSFALLLQQRIGGRLARSAFGPRWVAWETSLEAQTARLGEPLPPGPSPFLETGLAAAGSPRAPAASVAVPEFPNILAMSAMKPRPGHGGSSPKSLQEVLNEWRENRPAAESQPTAEPGSNLEIQLSGGKTAAGEPLQFYREGVLNLLENPGRPFPMRWNGPLGSALRGNAELRRALQESAAQGETRWIAQLHEKNFELRRLVLLEHSEQGWRPRRVLIGEQVIRYDESQDPTVYDLEIFHGERPEILSRILRDGVSEPWRVDGYWTRRASAEAAGEFWQWELYPKSSYYLKVEMGRSAPDLLQITDLYLHRLLQWSAPRPPASGVRTKK